MKRFAFNQMNTCASTDASACAAASVACRAASAMGLNMDTAILAVSIFCALIGMIFGLISILGNILVLVFLVLSICVWIAADNCIWPKGRIKSRAG